VGLGVKTLTVVLNNAPTGMGENDRLVFVELRVPPQPSFNIYEMRSTWRDYEAGDEGTLDRLIYSAIRRYCQKIRGMLHFVARGCRIILTDIASRFQRGTIEGGSVDGPDAADGMESTDC
jgi:hypothetical protein